MTEVIKDAEFVETPAVEAVGPTVILEEVLDDPQVKLANIRNEFVEVVNSLKASKSILITAGPDGFPNATIVSPSSSVVDNYQELINLMAMGTYIIMQQAQQEAFNVQVKAEAEAKAASEVAVEAVKEEAVIVEAEASA